MSAIDAVISMNLSNIAILKIKGSNCLGIISGINESDAINVMQNINLTKKVKHYEA